MSRCPGICLAAEFEALGGALTMALAQEAEAGGALRECWLAHERLRVLEARSINRAEFLTACTDTTAEAAEVAAAEAAAAEVVATMEAAAACRRRGGHRKSHRRCAWCASGLGARAAERAWWRRE